MAATTGAQEPENGAVAIMLAGRSERLTLEVAALLAQELPRIGGPAFEKAVQILRARFPAQIAGAMLNDFILVLSEMAHGAHLPRLRVGRSRAANRDEVFFAAMLAALQHGDKGRAIEAAIAMLDTGRVNGVILAAQALARRLAENGVLLSGLHSEIFDFVAGYPAVEGARETSTSRALERGGVRPSLTLLQSA